MDVVYCSIPVLKPKCTILVTDQFGRCRGPIVVVELTKLRSSLLIIQMYGSRYWLITRLVTIPSKAMYFTSARTFAGARVEICHVDPTMSALYGMEH